MNPILQKTIGGLSAQYYGRHLFFGAAMSTSLLFMLQGKYAPYELWGFAILNTLLYPYSRFVYESVTGFIVGQNFFMVNAILLLMVKCFTMILCWAFAMFVAPVGWAYLYYAHSKRS